MLNSVMSLKFSLCSLFIYFLPFRFALKSHPSNTIYNRVCKMKRMAFLFPIFKLCSYPFYLSFGPCQALSPFRRLVTALNNIMQIIARLVCQGIGSGGIWGAWVRGLRKSTPVRCCNFYIGSPVDYKGRCSAVLYHRGRIYRVLALRQVHGGLCHRPWVHYHTLLRARVHCR
jgi:hypothetical protein